ncbi:MAG: DUF4143 domain-containing protein [bacterium]
MQRLNEYNKRDYRFSYLRSHGGAEVDFVIERPGKPVALVEVKSAKRVDASVAKHLHRFHGDFPGCECFLLSLDTTPQMIGPVCAFYWEQGLRELGLDRIS